MAVTIHDVVVAHAGVKDSYSADDYHKAGVAMIGGCGGCGATLAGYNAYPSKGGVWACSDCLGDEGNGFATVDEFNAWCVKVDERSE